MSLLLGGVPELPGTGLRSPPGGPTPVTPGGRSPYFAGWEDESEQGKDQVQELRLEVVEQSQTWWRGAGWGLGS